MRFWLLSNTFYGTWLPGDRRGSVTSVRDRRPGDATTDFRFEHDMPGEPYEEGMAGLHYSAREQCKGPPVYLDRPKAEVLLAQFQETAAYRLHALLAVAIMWNHSHWVVRTTDDPDPRRLLADHKAYGTRALNDRFGWPPSETRWTSKGSKRKLRDAAAVAAAIHYVLYKQPAPLVVWSPETGRIV